MDWKKKDNVSWRELKVDDRIWSHNGLVLGKCIFIGTTGRSWDPDPYFSFENGMVLSGLFLEFTQIIEV
jgi:hypothetical protein